MQTVYLPDIASILEINYHYYFMFQSSCFLNKKEPFPLKWQVSEISKQIHIPQQQCLLDWKWYQHSFAKAWIAINRLSIIWKFDLFDKISF